MDLRVSGKDLIQNHLSFCLYTHASVWAGRQVHLPQLTSMQKKFCLTCSPSNVHQSLLCAQCWAARFLRIVNNVQSTFESAPAPDQNVLMTARTGSRARCARMAT